MIEASGVASSPGSSSNASGMPVRTLIPVTVEKSQALVVPEAQVGSSRHHIILPKSAVPHTPASSLKPRFVLNSPANSVSQTATQPTVIFQPSPMQGSLIRNQLSTSILQQTGTIRMPVVRSPSGKFRSKQVPNQHPNFVFQPSATGNTQQIMMTNNVSRTPKLVQISPLPTGNVSQNIIMVPVDPTVQSTSRSNQAQVVSVLPQKGTNEGVQTAKAVPNSARNISGPALEASSAEIWNTSSKLKPNGSSGANSIRIKSEPQWETGYSPTIQKCKDQTLSKLRNNVLGSMVKQEGGQTSQSTGLECDGNQFIADGEVKEEFESSREEVLSSRSTRNEMFSAELSSGELSTFTNSSSNMYIVQARQNMSYSVSTSTLMTPRNVVSNAVPVLLVGNKHSRSNKETPVVL